MDRADPQSFYRNRKWCPSCDRYVSYLMSVTTSYCVECGGEARLFSKVDWESFSESMEARRPRVKRRKKANSERRSA
ncbi:MAG: hypothetical protein VX460_08325 [Planctomycetota bacterium]|nr:hypothetical protein [Planctomycetota bacterium]